MSFTLWPHQQQALEFLHKQLDAGYYAGLFMGVGTGKTAVALSYISQADLGLTLVITTKRSAYVWKRDIHKFFPELGVVELYDGTIIERVEQLKYYSKLLNGKKAKPQHIVMVMNYDILSNKKVQDALWKLPIKMIVADEAQHLKSHSSKQSKYAASLADHTCARRLAMTGTPFHNRPLDIFGIARFLNRKIFGSAWTVFRMHYATWYGPHQYILGKYINQDELRKIVDEFAFYVDRDKVLDLPEVKHLIRWQELPDKWYAQYKELEKEYITQLEDGTILTVDNALTVTLRLRQFLDGAIDMFGERAFTSPVKVNAVLELMDEIPEDEPIVIYYMFTAGADLIKDALAAQGYKYGELSGRIDQREAWENGETQVLLVQLSAGSEGLDLYRAAYAVYFDLPWSYGVYEQSLGRLDRPGQEREVQFIYLLVKGTIDEAVRKGLKFKDMSARFILNAMENTYERNI